MRHFEIYRREGEYATFPAIARVAGDIYVAFRVVEGDNSETHVDTRSWGMILRLDKQGGGEGRHYMEIGGSDKFSGVQEVVIMGEPPRLYWFEWKAKKGAHTKSAQEAVVKGVYRADMDLRKLTIGDRGLISWPKLAVSHAPVHNEQSDWPDIITPAYGDIGDGYSRCVGLGDDGVSWDIASKKGVDFCEPCLVWWAGSLHVFCLLRREQESKSKIYQAHSWDAGKSWTSPAKTGIEGEGAHVIRLDDGRLLCTYGHRKRPYGIRACYSYDEGITWDYEDFVTIRDDGGGGDIGYPKSLELEGGEVLTIYYFYTQDDETRRILGSVWRPEQDTRSRR